jgi:hypothetical protein
MAEDAVKRMTRNDAYLRQTSWDGTWNRIRRLVDRILADSGLDISANAADGATAG